MYSNGYNRRKTGETLNRQKIFNSWDTKQPESKAEVPEVWSPDEMRVELDLYRQALCKKGELEGSAKLDCFQAAARGIPIMR